MLMLGRLLTHSSYLKTHRVTKVSHLHFGEAARTSRSLNLYMPTPGRKANHNMRHVVSVPHTKYLVLTVAAAVLY